MTTLQEASTKALDALRKAMQGNLDFDVALEAFEALRTALAQQAATKNCPQPEICGSKECEFCRDTAAPAPQAQQMEPTDDQLVKGVKAMRLFVTKNSVADFKLGYMAALAAAPAPQAQPVAQPLSDDEILTIVHRKATRYTHAVAPGQVTYGFTVAHLLDFANSIREVK